MNATTAYRKARAAQQARKSLYAIRYFPAQPGTEWRLYTADLRTILIGGFCKSAASAKREAENAVRVRIEYPENYAHEFNEKTAA
jgi:hypothetical protein